jgi:hypothetical protein
VYGQLIGTGRLVRLTATCRRPPSGASKVELNDVATGTDRLADSPPVLLRELDRTCPIGATRITLIGSNPPGSGSAGRTVLRRVRWVSATAVANWRLRRTAISPGLQPALAGDRPGPPTRCHGLSAPGWRASTTASPVSSRYRSIWSVTLPGRTRYGHWPHARLLALRRRRCGATRRPSVEKIWRAYHFAAVPAPRSPARQPGRHLTAIAIDSAFAPSGVHPIEIPHPAQWRRRLAAPSDRFALEATDERGGNPLTQMPMHRPTGRRRAPPGADMVHASVPGPGEIGRC